ncbi:calnexin-like isoform X1 [Macrosteles quadrilineatus]|uniref:calnexin-like isoform X1 n=1 Tax=Macrosteles quadrilineatus TaxID=74068 RepID=UPI0023E0AF3B|nr:calnexin-like isoform X1 [Macrosteles quadrilineatus]
MRLIGLTCLLFLCGVALVKCNDGEASVEVDDSDEAEAVVETVDDVDYVTPTLPPGSSVYMAEHFDDPASFNRKWVKSEAKKEGIDEDIAKYDGVWQIEPAERDPLKGDLGLVLKSKAKHSAISAKLDRPFVFRDKPLIVQYEVIHQNGQECGGAYLKLLSEDKQSADLRKLHDKTPYTIMFGPDKCGNDYKLHFIFRHKNPVNGTLTEKHCKKPKERLDEPFTDKTPHLYTLIVKPDNSFQVLLDHKVVNEGSLLEDFTPPVNPPQEIDDPNDVKPKDWDEREKIPDAEARKPEDWDEDAPQFIPDPSASKPDGWLDDEPENIPDPTAEKPSDWDEEMDGEWEAPLVPNPACEEAPGCGEWKAPDIVNPDFKGKWRAPMIDNPNYQGKWSPRRIPNPDYFEDKHPYKMTTIFAVGFELWTMSNQILFDNVLITDDPAVATNWAAQTFDLKRRKIEKEAESVVTAFFRYTNEHPWLWAVYVVVIGLPIVLVVFLCCSGSSSQEKEEIARRAEAKKTDALLPDDEMEEMVDETEGKEEDTAETTQESKKGGGSQKSNDSEEEVVEEPSGGSGDAPPSPRKRRPRKD